MRLRDQINQIRWVVLTKSLFELSNLSGWFTVRVKCPAQEHKTMIHSGLGKTVKSASPPGLNVSCFL